MMKSKDKAVTVLTKGVEFLLKKNKVTVFYGTGKIDGKGSVSVTDSEANIKIIRADHIILATGARAKTLPGMEPDGKRIWTYREAMVPEEVPESLLVVGSGAIGMEFASFYSDLGVDVTIVEVLDILKSKSISASLLLFNIINLVASFPTSSIKSSTVI